MEEQTESLGARIRRLRHERGLSQAELASEIGVSKGQVQLVEAGVTVTPRPGRLQRYAQALGVTFDHLLYGTDPKPPSEHAEWPPLEVCLRHTSTLGETEIAQVTRIVRALEAEQRRELVLRESQGQQDVS